MNHRINVRVLSRDRTHRVDTSGVGATRPWDVEGREGAGGPAEKGMLQIFRILIVPGIGPRRIDAKGEGAISGSPGNVECGEDSLSPGVRDVAELQTAKD